MEGCSATWLDRAAPPPHPARYPSAVGLVRLPESPAHRVLLEGDVPVPDGEREDRGEGQGRECRRDERGPDDRQDQAEIHRVPADAEEPLRHELAGFLEALNRSSWRRRQDWHLDYIEAIVQRDVRDIARIEQLDAMPRLLRALAEHSGQLVNHSGIGTSLGMNHVTTRRYMGILENLFLVHTLPPWYTNALKRVTKSPKLHFLDSGLLAALKGLTPKRLRIDRTQLGPVLETFVLGELLKLAGWADDRYALTHFRDKERNEVDIVIEDGLGRMVGVEVKASATVTRRDFSGLRRLAAASGERFVLGMVLYDHEQTVSFGERMAAVPISALWSRSPTPADPE